MLTTNTFTKGLQTDGMAKYQPEGTYRMALNAVLETEEGDLPGISNEIGNLDCSENYPTGKIPLGHALLDNEEVVLALYDSNGNHEIGIFNPSNCTYTTTYIDPCLNFDLCNPVNILFRVRNGCERVIYFCDGNRNKYRVLNLTNPPVPGNCNLLAFNPDYSQMCINFPIGEGDLSISDSGGNLKIGVYYYFFRYLDNEQNPTDWLFGTRGVPIADENYISTFNIETYHAYNGGSNIEDSPYYVPPTTKSVKFNLTNLDYTNFRYFQVAVVKRTGDAGEIEGVDVLNPVEMDDAGQSYWHTGYESQILYTTSIDEVLSNKLAVNTVTAHAQLNNRLFLAAPQATKYNFASYQRFASKIKVEWTKTPTTSPVDTFNKQPKYYQKDGSFMEDEIYALGVVFVHDDGTESPPFHIPGRAPDVVTGSNPAIGTLGVTTDAQPWDTGSVTTYGTTTAGRLTRWEQISTATQYASGPVAGLMGYHEAQTATYPVVNTCDDHVDGFWGRDWQDNLIDETVKIRHHRMPDTNLLTGFAPDTFRVGVRFSNITYPEGVVGHFFVYSNEEPSILAKGAMIPLYKTYTATPLEEYPNESHRKDSGDAYVYDPRRLRPEVLRDGPSIFDTPVITKVFAFLSPENLLRKVEYNPGYLRVEKFARELELELAPAPLEATNRKANQLIDIQVPDLINGKLIEKTLEIHTYMYDFTVYERPDFEHVNYDVDFTGRLEAANIGSRMANSMTIPTNDHQVVLNKSTHISPAIIQLGTEDIFEYVENGQTFADKLMLVSLKVWNDPYTALHNIRYNRMSNCVLIAASPAVIQVGYEGDTFTQRVPVMDYTYKQGFDGNGQTEEKYISSYFMQFVTHSTKVNYEFVHGGNTPEHQRFIWSYQYPSGHELFAQAMANKYYETVADVMSLYPIPYEYHESYSYMQGLRTYMPLPVFYDYCNDCLENSPFRVYYSELDNQEDSADAYRVIRPNNFRDLDGAVGSITDLFTNFGELFAATPNTIWNIPVQPQQMTTEESAIYIGTSEVLGVPPRQLKTSDNSFGGYNFFKSRVNTEYGTAYIDDITGRAFIVSNQLEDISLKGMRNWWQNNGKISFLKQFFELTGKRYMCKSTSSPFGVGYISTYDPRYKRILFHKRDFKIRPSQLSRFVYVDSVVDDPDEYNVPAKLWYNNFKFYYNYTSQFKVEIPFTNRIFFEDKSFTMSYSFLTQSWVSWHSYLPTYMFGGQLDFYSFKTDEYDSYNLSIYEHNHGPYTTYYDKKHPHIIDMIAVNSPLEVKTTANVFYISKATIYDATTGTSVPSDSTFDSLIAYNDTQTTGKMALLPKQPFDMDFSSSSAFVDKTDNQYRINNLRDLATSNYAPIWTTEWNFLEPVYYIDRIPNPANIDYTKSLFESKRLRDHYVGLRLFFENPNNIKITTDVVATTFANRNR